MGENREWMYKRYLCGGIIDPKFLEGLETFIRSALSQPRFRDGNMIKCPCTKCDNMPFRDQWIIRTHLCKYGFVRDYKIWRYHGETLGSSSNSGSLERGNESTSEDFRKKSCTTRKNRMTKPGGPGTGISIHRGGTRSAFDHGLHLAAQGREEDEIPFVVYNILHCKCGVYDNEKSVVVAEEYTRKVAEMSQTLPDGSVPVNINKPQILCNAAGGISDRGRLYGSGSQANTFKASSSSSHNNYDSDSAKLRRKVAELEEQLQKQAADSEVRIVEQQAILKAHEAQLQ